MGLPKTWITNELLTSAALNAQFVYVNSLVPVGTILPWDDHDGTVTFDTDIFCYCNGQTISDAASPLNGKVITDMSNRYLVGFGTENGGDIGTATWSATVVGNANHQVNLSHQHLTVGHYHGLNSHTHSTPGHNHVLSLAMTYNGGYLHVKEQTQSDTFVPNYKYAVTRTASTLGGTSCGFFAQNTNNSGGGTSGTPSTTNTTTTSDVSTSGTNLSTTQSIQPRSRQVRFIERYK